MELSYIFSENVFLIFWEMELSSTKPNKLQEETFRAPKVKKNYSEKILLYFGKWNFVAPNLNVSDIFFKKSFHI